MPQAGGGEAHSQLQALIKRPQSVTLDWIVFKTASPALRDKLMGIVIVKIFNQKRDFFYHRKYLQTYTHM